MTQFPCFGVSGKQGAARIIALALFLAGVRRFLSWIAVGQLDALMMGAMFVELSVPLLACGKTPVVRIVLADGVLWPETDMASGPLSCMENSSAGSAGST